MGWKYTDHMSFYPTVGGQFRVAKTLSGTMFISVGPGGHGSKYIDLLPEEALTLAHYLIAEAVRAQEVRAKEGGPKKK